MVTLDEQIRGQEFSIYQKQIWIRDLIQDKYRLVRIKINEDYRSVLIPGSFAGRATQSAKTDLNDFAFSPKWIYCMF